MSLKEMHIANSIQVDAVCQLLIEKEIITGERFYGKLKLVQWEYGKVNAQVLSNDFSKCVDSDYDSNCDSMFSNY